VYVILQSGHVNWTTPLQRNLSTLLIEIVSPRWYWKVFFVLNATLKFVHQRGILIYDLRCQIFTDVLFLYVVSYELIAKEIIIFISCSMIPIKY
jgi:hypothetical protein